MKRKIQKDRENEIPWMYTNVGLTFCKNYDGLHINTHKKQQISYEELFEHIESLFRALSFKTT